MVLEKLARPSIELREELVDHGSDSDELKREKGPGQLSVWATYMYRQTDTKCNPTLPTSLTSTLQKTKKKKDRLNKRFSYAAK